MAADRQLIIEALKNAKAEEGSVVFTIGDHYVQAQTVSSVEMYVEAVSHHYHSGIDIGLESSFIQMGFLLTEGGNYNRKYFTADDAAIGHLADDMIKIFNELCHSDIHLPFEISEV